jgi:hypothetical protein
VKHTGYQIGALTTSAGLSRNSARFSRALVLVALAAGTAADARAQVSAGAEVRHDRFAYRFENPSSFDTAELVPHFFEQRYDLDHVWLFLSARYEIAGLTWETSAGFTPQQQRAATDFDTFFDPDGTMWVVGTTGTADVRSFRVNQRVRLGRVGPVEVTGGYRFRFDRADFVAPSHKSVRRNGTTVQAFDVATHELTHGQLHEVFVGTSLTRPLATGWRIVLDGDVTPGAVARLMVRLPEKYPGQDLHFRTTALTVLATATLERTATRWPVAVAVDAGRAWSYHGGGRIARDGLGVRVSLGRGW